MVTFFPVSVFIKWVDTWKERMRFLKMSLMLVVVFASAMDEGAIESVQAPGMRPCGGVALIITGAAARISQEAALIQALDERGLLKDLVFISGDSSGALNAVAYNAMRSGRMSWKRYREILAGLRNGDIFVQPGRKFPVDTSPLRALLTRVIEGEMGYRSIGDLPIPTAITIPGSRTWASRGLPTGCAARRSTPSPIHRSL